MDKEKLKQEYELIAQFMGYKYVPFNQDNEKISPGWYRVENPEKILSEKVLSQYYLGRTWSSLDFRYDFNKLLWVVLEIEDLKSQRLGGFRVIIEGDECRIVSKRLGKIFSYNVLTHVKGNKKGAVYQACVEFIKWYNGTGK